MNPDGSLFLLHFWMSCPLQSVFSSIIQKVFLSWRKRSPSPEATERLWLYKSGFSFFGNAISDQRNKKRRPLDQDTPQSVGNSTQKPLSATQRCFFVIATYKTYAFFVIAQQNSVKIEICTLQYTFLLNPAQGKWLFRLSFGHFRGGVTWPT